MADRKTCFVLMPFDTRYREVYDQVYKPIAKAAGLRCWRVDEVARPGSITRDIIEGIVKADIIIADLTSRNANVFYELGIAHSVGNKTIMTAQARADVPFDIANYRVIFYAQSIAGSKKLAASLAAAIRELLQALDRTNNPVQEVTSGALLVGARRKVPLIKHIDLPRLRPIARAYLDEKGIVYVDDLRRLDLSDMASRPGIGKDTMAGFCTQLLNSDIFPNGEALHRFMVSHGISKRPHW